LADQGKKKERKKSQKEEEWKERGGYGKSQTGGQGPAGGLKMGRKRVGDGMSRERSRGNKGRKKSP